MCFTSTISIRLHLNSYKFLWCFYDSRGRLTRFLHY
ncbi:hypothetical protein E2C01_078126 [Portunus trituberculatus]|uniref:Uncharacterized protein n=1 Tax=Portunus trituberculatus TaxID=210409 RepID=A0A5B7IPB8_PORTR|nr:hypothetical protein [Portunus trituberculatus]